MRLTGGKDEPGKYHCTKAGFINGIDQFDPLEFGISAKEAAHFDPAIRLSLEAAHAVGVPSPCACITVHVPSRHSKILVLITGVPTLAFSLETCLPPQTNLTMIGMRSTTTMGWGVVSPSAQIVSRLLLTFVVLPSLLIPVRSVTLQTDGRTNQIFHSMLRICNGHTSRALLYQAWRD